MPIQRQKFNFILVERNLMNTHRSALFRKVKSAVATIKAHGKSTICVKSLLRCGTTPQQFSMCTNNLSHDFSSTWNPTHTLHCVHFPLFWMLFTPQCTAPLTLFFGSVFEWLFFADFIQRTAWYVFYGIIQFSYIYGQLFR